MRIASGYEMKKICHEQFTHYTDINLSSIYSTLKGLEKNAMIKRQGRPRREDGENVSQ